MSRKVIIAAIARNRAIGFENRLLYSLPNDMKRFRTLTTGHTIIMGRKTFESFPKGALPNRRNIVLSRQDIVFPGAERFSSLEEALRNTENEELVYIIGGDSVYKASMDIADELDLTLVDDVPEKADAFFPEFSDDIWVEKYREDMETDERHLKRYSFVDYVRKN